MIPLKENENINKDLDGENVLIVEGNFSTNHSNSFNKWVAVYHLYLI